MNFNFKKIKEIVVKNFHKMNIDCEYFKCCCGNICKWSEGKIFAPSPVALPVCDRCFVKGEDCVERHF